MTTALAGKEAAARLEKVFPASIVESDRDYIVIKPEALLKVISYLKATPEFDFNFLNNITSTDYFDYFEVVYHLSSLNSNKSLVVKTRVYGRENLVVQSIVDIYQGADFQEREIYDLMGISFKGHPRMKRIMLWEGFEGHPLRKDYLG